MAFPCIAYPTGAWKRQGLHDTFFINNLPSLLVIAITHTFSCSQIFKMVMILIMMRMIVVFSLEHARIE